MIKNRKKIQEFIKKNRKKIISVLGVSSQRITYYTKNRVKDDTLEDFYNRVILNGLESYKPKKYRVSVEGLTVKEIVLKYRVNKGLAYQCFYRGWVLRDSVTEGEKEFTG